MDPKTRAIIIGASALFILAAVVGVVVYLGRASSSLIGSNKPTSTNSLSELPVAPGNNTNTTTSNIPNTTNAINNTATQNTNIKTYQGQGFNIKYPKEWGVLTCNNSQSFEFDPYSANDLRGIVCNEAIKPVTVLVTSQVKCQGETVKIGDRSVVKSKTVGQNGDIDYRWCLSATGKSLDITHRVSSSGSRATGKDDFSAQIEQIISSFQLGGAS